MSLLPIADPRWSTYRGGYNRRPVSALPAFLNRLRSYDLSEADWDILWDDLHHQGDVGEASYAVVPYLLDYARHARVIAWHAFGFAAVVELARTEGQNPAVPAEVERAYHDALKELPRVGLDRVDAWGENVFEPLMACLALSLGRRKHAQAYLDMTETEIEGFDRYVDNG